MSFSIEINSSSDNPDASLHIVIGNSVSTQKVIQYISDNIADKEKVGLISRKEAEELFEVAEEKIKLIEHSI